MNTRKEKLSTLWFLVLIISPSNLLLEGDYFSFQIIYLQVLSKSRAQCLIHSSVGTDADYLKPGMPACYHWCLCQL